MKKVNNREMEYDADDIFPNRWSSRAMSAEMIDDKVLMTLFEAARWAPSSYNNQPWRFIYAKRGTKNFEEFFNLLLPLNQSWCKNAAVLVVIASKKTFDHNGKPDSSHSFSTGAAWENLALQASMLGLVTHGIGGFDHDNARTKLAIPEDYSVEMMIAIGKPGTKDQLPEELKSREIPNHRKKLSEIIFEGKFHKNS